MGAGTRNGAVPGGKGAARAPSQAWGGAGYQQGAPGKGPGLGGQPQPGGLGTRYNIQDPPPTQPTPAQQGKGPGLGGQMRPGPRGIQPGGQVGPPLLEASPGSGFRMSPEEAAAHSAAAPWNQPGYQQPTFEDFAPAPQPGPAVGTPEWAAEGGWSESYPGSGSWSGGTIGGRPGGSLQIDYANPQYPGQFPGFRQPGPAYGQLPGWAQGPHNDLINRGRANKGPGLGGQPQPYPGVPPQYPGQFPGFRPPGQGPVQPIGRVYPGPIRPGPQPYPGQFPGFRPPAPNKGPGLGGQMRPYPGVRYGQPAPARSGPWSNIPPGVRAGGIGGLLNRQQRQGAMDRGYNQLVQDQGYNQNLFRQQQDPRNMRGFAGRPTPAPGPNMLGQSPAAPGSALEEFRRRKQAQAQGVPASQEHARQLAWARGQGQS